jgi:hypothetical protein
VVVEWWTERLGRKPEAELFRSLTTVKERRIAVKKVAK